MPHPTQLDPDKLLEDCKVIQTKRSGPGGQHRNKVQTAIVIEHKPTGCVAEASESRSQGENRSNAIFRLRLTLARQVRHYAELEDFVLPEVWAQRLRNGRIVISANHDDFPVLLCIAIDVLTLCDWHVSSASQQLCVSGSQLLKFIQLDRLTFERLNRERKMRGLRSLS